MLDLRKPKNFEGIHTGYVNYGSCDYPNWHTVKQICPEKDVEIIRKPNAQTLQDLNNMTRGSISYMNTLESSKISINDLEEIKEIHVINYYNYFIALYFLYFILLKSFIGKRKKLT